MTDEKKIDAASESKCGKLQVQLETTNRKMRDMNETYGFFAILGFCALFLFGGAALINSTYSSGVIEGKVLQACSTVNGAAEFHSEIERPVIGNNARCHVVVNGLDTIKLVPLASSN